MFRMNKQHRFQIFEIEKYQFDTGNSTDGIKFTVPTYCTLIYIN